MKSLAVGDAGERSVPLGDVSGNEGGEKGSQQKEKPGMPHFILEAKGSCPRRLG